MDEPEITAFLSKLATRGVSASTQNQALNAPRDCRSCSHATKSHGY
jgi:hypothetical protein